MLIDKILRFGKFEIVKVKVVAVPHWPDLRKADHCEILAMDLDLLHFL